MAATSSRNTLEALEPLIGEWSMLAGLRRRAARRHRRPRHLRVAGRASGSWSSAGRFRFRRRPTGSRVIGADPESEGGFLQHYFDSRGVARVYKMSFEDGVWKLWRDEPDFSPLEFSQRFTGTFSDDGKTIAGTWEIAHDGKTWEHDFDLTYVKQA